RIGLASRRGDDHIVTALRNGLRAAEVVRRETTGVVPARIGELRPGRSGDTRVVGAIEHSDPRARISQIDAQFAGAQWGEAKLNAVVHTVRRIPSVEGGEDLLEHAVRATEEAVVEHREVEATGRRRVKCNLGDTAAEEVAAVWGRRIHRVGRLAEGQR